MIAPLFEPDLVLPSQLLRPGVLRPERRLLLAVLEDAIVRLRRDNDAGAEALAWFESDRWCWGSFRMIADELGVDDVEGARRFARDVRAGRIRFGRIHRRVAYRARTKAA